MWCTTEINIRPAQGWFWDARYMYIFLAVNRLILASKNACFTLSTGERPSMFFERRDPSVIFPGLSDETPETLLFWYIPIIIPYFYQVVHIVPASFPFFTLGCCFRCSVGSLCFTTFGLFLLCKLASNAFTLLVAQGFMYLLPFNILLGTNLPIPETILSLNFVHSWLPSDILACSRKSSLKFLRSSPNSA